MIGVQLIQPQIERDGAWHHRLLEQMAKAGRHERLVRLEIQFEQADAGLVLRQRQAFLGQVAAQRLHSYPTGIQHDHGAHGQVGGEAELQAVHG